MVSRADVARLAGVSPAVVSYVTNGSHPVGAQTRARVVAAIQGLGYRPNALARGLAMSRSHTLGLLVPDSSNPYFAELALAIEAAAHTAGFTVLFGNGDDNIDREMAYVRIFVDYKVDGVIVCPSNDFSHGFEALVSAGVPVVSTDRISKESTLPIVEVDNSGGAHLATEHLISHGRHIFACISGPCDMVPAKARVAGWEDALKQAGIPVDQDLVSFVNFNVKAGSDAAQQLFLRNPDIDALFVASDLQAVGAIRALTDLGRRIGPDVSVIGFDGIRLGEYIRPRLTTVEQPFREIAAAVLSRLLHHINHGDPQTAPHILPTALKLRESCGCPVVDSA